MSLLKYIDRKNTDSVKWDALEGNYSRGDLLPMWVADMDFQVPECVSAGLKKYIGYGAFGYYYPPAAYYDAFINWEKKYHGYEVQREWMRFAPGVVPAFHWLVSMLAGEGESVAVMTPVYYPFFKAVNNNGRRLVECPLKLTDSGYIMDFEAFEETITREDVKAFIFCSPHNPVGRVWKKDEIRRMLDVCKKHHVFVISDEIHHDIIMSGHEHVPAATAGDEPGAYDDMLITLTAATKTFNLASLQNSIVIIPDAELRRRWDDFTKRISIIGGNAFGYVAVRSAYEGGRPWLEELLEVIEGNYRYMRERLEAELPDVRVSDLEGTYLMWVDLSAYMNAIMEKKGACAEVAEQSEAGSGSALGPADAMQHLMEDECGIAVDYGAWFGGDEYAGCIRLNLATCRENVELAADRIIAALK